jgi:hypothetical protein
VAVVRGVYRTAKHNRTEHRALELKGGGAWVLTNEGEKDVLGWGGVFAIRVVWHLFLSGPEQTSWIGRKSDRMNELGWNGAGFPVRLEPGVYTWVLVEIGRGGGVRGLGILRVGNSPAVKFETAV